MFGKTASVQLPNALDYYNDMPSMLDGAVPLLVLALSFLLVGLHVAKVRLMKVQPALPIKTGKSKPKQRRQRRGKQGKAHSGAQRHVIVQQRPAQHQDGVTAGRTGSKKGDKLSTRYSEIDVESAVVPTEEISEPERPDATEETASEGDCESGLQTRAIAEQTQGCRSANDLHMGETLAAAASPCALEEPSPSPGSDLMPKQSDAAAADEEEKEIELEDHQVESQDLPVESEDLLVSTIKEEDEQNEENDNEEKWSEWGCSSRQIYYRELLLAHCSISKRIARGPPGLTLPEERKGDAAGHLGITLVARD